MFLPHDSGGMPVQNMNSADINETKLDEWLMTVACWAYGNDKTEFGILSGSSLGGKGMMQGGENAQVRGMIAVYTRFLSQFINAINRDVLDAPYAKSHWIGLEPPEDELVTAQVHQTYIGLVYTADYVADQLGIPEKYRIKKDAAAPTTPEGFVGNIPVVPPVIPEGHQANVSALALAQPVKTPEQALKFQHRAISADLKQWDEKATRFSKKGWKQEDFVDTILPDELRKYIASQIRVATSPEEVHAVFTDALKSAHDEIEQMTKSVIHPAVDPNQAIKDAAANEMTRVMAEYLDGLMHRITSKAVELK
jgi:hypothetical protein